MQEDGELMNVEVGGGSGVDAVDDDSEDSAFNMEE